MWSSGCYSAYFGGDSINTTENRAVLHTALRSATPTAVRVKGAAIAPGIAEVKAKMKDFSTSVIEGQWKGHTEKSNYHNCQYRYRRFRSGPRDGV